MALVTDISGRKWTVADIRDTNHRDQHQNKRRALAILSAKVEDAERSHAKATYNDARRAQLDGGGRGNKVRTYNFIESRAVDHRTGKKTREVREVIGKGRFELLR